jgi:hypothetical protein
MARNKGNSLTPEPFGVYAWLMVIAITAMSVSILLICKELNEFYKYDADQLWEISLWLFNQNPS